MAKYDDAAWHYGGDFPQDLQKENAATHIGMFVVWCIDNHLIAEVLFEECREAIEKIKKRELTGAEFLMNYCDEKFTDEDLNEFGNSFAKDYYEDGSSFGENFGSYNDDYSSTFEEKSENESLAYQTTYHIENTFENYYLLKPIIDKRFEQWKKFKNK